MTQLVGRISALNRASPPNRRGAPVSDGLRCRVEVVTTSGRAALVVFEVRIKTVQVWHHRRLSGVFDRATLKSWLAEPHLPIMAADVTLSLDRMVDHGGRLALTLPDVTAWVLSPAEFHDLTTRV